MNGILLVSLFLRIKCPGKKSGYGPYIPISSQYTRIYWLHKIPYSWVFHDVPGKWDFCLSFSSTNWIGDYTGPDNRSHSKCFCRDCANVFFFCFGLKLSQVSGEVNKFYFPVKRESFWPFSSLRGGGMIPRKIR